MYLNFYKYEGAGNDFVLFDNRSREIDVNGYDWFAKLCDRHFGVGADGVMLLQNRADYDFEMLYYNADGRPGSMCGNGGRCIVAFAKHLGLVKGDTHFWAPDGAHYAEINTAGDWVSLQMSDVERVERVGDDYVLNTGSPHLVRLMTDISLASLDVRIEGKKLRYSDLYAEKGINVNFVQLRDEGYVLRTYERGVENETYACGTGATAVAMAMAKHFNKTGQIKTPIKVLGGELDIRFNYDGRVFTDVFLEGPAKRVFEGKWI